jgi:hypothetical protein
VLTDKLNDMLPQLISSAANTVTMFFRRIGERRIVKMPLVPPDGCFAACAGDLEPVARQLRNASAIRVRHEFPEQRNSPFGLRMVVDLYLQRVKILSG